MLKTGPSFCYHCPPHLYSVFWACLEPQQVSICAKIVFFYLQNCRDVKMRFFEEKIAFSCFVFVMLLQEKQKKKKQNGKKPRTLSKYVFKVVIHKWEFWRHGFLAKVAWHYLCQEGRKKRAFRAHYLFWPKSFGPKTVKTRKIYKTRGFSGMAQNQKWHLFWKRCFWHGWKSGFY